MLTSECILEPSIATDRIIPDSGPRIVEIRVGRVLRNRGAQIGDIRILVVHDVSDHGGRNREGQIEHGANNDTRESEMASSLYVKY